MNVLLVDDEVAIRKMVTLMLQSGGFRVFEAADGAAALALFQEHPIDLLVTDVVMEGMDGWTLARAAAERRAELPVLFMSGYPVGFENFRRQHGRCAFLPKPFLKGELIGAITELAATPV